MGGSLSPVNCLSSVCLRTEIALKGNPGGSGSHKWMKNSNFRERRVSNGLQEALFGESIMKTKDSKFTGIFGGGKAPAKRWGGEKFFLSCVKDTAFHDLLA